MDNKQILGALAMDLKRVAIGINRKSFGMADKFLIEAMKRKNELKIDDLLPYMQQIINRVEALVDLESDLKAEDALMYSTRIQNYVLNK